MQRAIYDDDKVVLFSTFAVSIALTLLLFTVQKVMLGSMRCDTEAALRARLIQAVLYKDAEWFDRPLNSPVMLARAVTEGVKKVSERTIKQIFLSFEGMITGVIGFCIGLYICWQ